MKAAGHALRIDGHAHCGGSCRDRESILRMLRRNALDAVLLCGGEPVWEQDCPYPLLSALLTGEGLGFSFNRVISLVVASSDRAADRDAENRRAAALARALPGRVYNGWWVAPEADSLSALAAAQAEYGFRFLKLHQCWHAFDANSPRLAALSDWAAERGLPIFLHLRDREQALRLAALANTHPAARYVDAHLLGADTLARSLRGENVFFDLSSPQLYSQEMLTRALDRFGAKRLLAGSDSPYGRENLRVVERRLGRLGLCEAELDDICGNNWGRLLGL